MNDLGNSPGRIALTDFQAYLHVLAVTTLAGRRLDRPLRGKITPSDIVQDTLLKAHQNIDQFQGRNRRQMACWLRSILTRTISNRIRDLQRQRRGGGRVESLEEVLERSAYGLEVLANSSQSSPINKASRKEEVQRLAEALDRLPEDQREAVLLHHCLDWNVLEIARHLGRTLRAVAGLLRRGREALRKEIDGGG